MLVLLSFSHLEPEFWSCCCLFLVLFRWLHVRSSGGSCSFIWCNFGMGLWHSCLFSFHYDRQPWAQAAAEFCYSLLISWFFPLLRCCKFVLNPTDVLAQIVRGHGFMPPSLSCSCHGAYCTGKSGLECVIL